MEFRSKRSNFSVLERDILLRLIEANIEVIESKRNDGMTVRGKDAAWSRIVAGFNAEANVVKRTHRQLRKYWNNLKMRSKKSVCSNGFAAFRLPTAGSAGLGAGRAACRSPGATPDGAAVTGAVACEMSTASTLGTLAVKAEPKELWTYQEPGLPMPGGGRGEVGGEERRSPVQLADEEADSYPERSNGEMAADAEADFEEIQNSDAEEIGEVFQCESDCDYRHETAAGVMGDAASNLNQWTAMDYARNEHEAKMALLSVQMETAHEQRELAREVREQTRQRHRLEMQVLEEKRRYRRMKMNSLSLHGHALVHESRAPELKPKTSLDKS